MSLLHRRAAPLLTRGDSEREDQDRLFLFNPFSGSCLLAKRGAPVAGWQISGNRRPLPVLSPYTHTPLELACSLAAALPAKNSPIPESHKSALGCVLYKRQGVGTRGEGGGGEGGAPQSRLPAVVKAELGRGAPTSAAA